MEQYVRHLYVWGPQISVSVSDPKPSTDLPGFKEVVVTASAGPGHPGRNLLHLERRQADYQGRGLRYRNNPFESDKDKLKTDLQPSFGEPGAPGGGRDIQRLPMQLLQGRSQDYPPEFPLRFQRRCAFTSRIFPLEPIHPWAKPAAVAGRCVFRQKPAAFWDYHDWIFAHQDEISPENLKEKVGEWTKTKGIEPIQFAACIDNKATEPEVDKSQAEGRALGINSTPTLFVNGRKLVGNLPWPQVKRSSIMRSNTRRLTGAVRNAVK